MNDSCCSMREKLNRVAISKWIWIALITLGVTQEMVALTYQYAWDELPCVLCIHVRLWILGFILVSIVGLLARKSWLTTLAHTLNTLIFIGLFERSYMLLGTERGTVIASCNFDLGLPSWLAFDQWWPAVFEVQASCGYTPELLFGITMAEGLIVMSAGLIIVSAILTVASLYKSRLET